MNVRLSEGGAAGVARTLADELRSRGIESPFAYGYSKGGAPSPLEVEYDALRITPAPIAALNRAAYSLIGRETKLTSHSKWNAFRERLASADVIHLHAVHSHIVDASILVDALVDAGKPVVWTLHDQWTMTGRCAQPGDCAGWKTGCLACPNLAAYPPAKVDNAARRWRERRDLIDRLSKAVPFRMVACADWLAREALIAYPAGVSVVRNAVDSSFWEACKVTERAQNQADSTLFMCRDLRDANKVSWPLLRTLATLPNHTLTIVGDNAEQSVEGATSLPALSDRTALAALMKSHTRLVFTSRVDYFPLTIIEALTAGMEVFAIDSEAAREFSSEPRVHTFANERSLLEAVSKHSRDLRVGTHETISSSIQEFFAPTRMADEYISIYEELTAR
ncbi:glycosyltransferase [Frondihabitans sp. PAMC 28766]|uniref:glycosyltransferase n=1 Tax=Frondihabitans sp. PAMC 28766 TaxID=1795630 RepID=UPI000A65EC14